MRLTSLTLVHQPLPGRRLPDQPRLPPSGVVSVASTLVATAIRRKCRLPTHISYPLNISKLQKRRQMSSLRFKAALG